MQRIASAEKMVTINAGSGSKAQETAAEARAATVWGCYSAVHYADTMLLQRLADELPHLLHRRQLQKGAYCTHVVSSLLGDASVSACMHLMDEHTVVREGLWLGWGLASHA